MLTVSSLLCHVMSRFCVDLVWEQPSDPWYSEGICSEQEEEEWRQLHTIKNTLRQGINSFVVYSFLQLVYEKTLI